MHRLFDIWAYWNRAKRLDRWRGPASGVLSVHPDVFPLSRRVFDRTRHARLECGLFWYGERRESGSTVVAIVIPEQTNRPGNYHVTGVAMEQVSDLTRPLRWKNLAQVHTHPGREVDHSPYDDEQVVSRHILSLVFPNYGAPFHDWAPVVGVHEFIEGRWRRWDERAARNRLVVSANNPVPQLFDLRTSR